MTFRRPAHQCSDCRLWLLLPDYRYGAEQGQGSVREAICSRLYAGVGRKPQEIFVSDGSKCDIGRLQLMFGADVTVALQVCGAQHCHQCTSLAFLAGGCTADDLASVCGAACRLPGRIWLAPHLPPVSETHCCCPCASLQDPAYPVYVDSSVIMGMTGNYNGMGFDGIQYMTCRPENDFFPDLSKV